MKNENVIEIISNMISGVETVKLEYDAMVLLNQTNSKINYIK